MYQEGSSKDTPLSLLKGKDGRFKRVWVEQKVKEINSVSSLQGEISTINLDFVPANPEKLHMTIAHLGIPEELYEEFKRVNLDLSFNQFLDQFYLLLQKNDEAIKEEVEVQAEKLGILGNFPHHVAAIKIVNTPEILQSRHVVMQSLEEFVGNLGITDVDTFMRQSQNLRFNPDDVYLPHITLGYVGKNKTLPQIEVSDLRIVLQPSEIGGVEKNKRTFDTIV